MTKKAFDLPLALKFAKDASEKTIRGTGISLFGEIIGAAPVITGRLRGNWQCTLNTPATGTLDRTSPDSLSAAQGFKIKNKLFLTNNLTYAVPTEYGSSTQKPNGYVRIHIAKFQAKLGEHAAKNKIK